MRTVTLTDVIDGETVITETHDPYCTRCEHDCAWRGLVIGAPFCSVCDDHGEAVHAGFGDDPCDCPDHDEEN